MTDTAERDGGPDPASPAPKDPPSTPPTPAPAATPAGTGATPPSPVPTSEQAKKLRGAKRPNRPTVPKLATRVYDRKYIGITGNPTGRPPVNDALLKPRFLAALRGGNNIGDSLAYCGVTDTVLTRWRREDITFEEQIEMARAQPKVVLTSKLVQLAMGTENTPPDRELLKFYISRQVDGYGKKAVGVSADVGREIRAFVGAAFRQSEGVQDPNAIPRYDEEDVDAKEEAEAKAGETRPPGPGQGAA